MIVHENASAVHAVPAQRIAYGFRLLVLREFRTQRTPPAFAFIEQRLLRNPGRQNRHGLSFANAFLPEVVAWLSEHFGRPSLREGDGPPSRNPLWPTLNWYPENRLWTDGTSTIEWFAEIIFRDETSVSAFEQRWQDRLKTHRRFTKDSVP
jgi:hypothetical protein